QIGHTESTSGLAALIKSVYILETGLIAPSIHLQQRNPRIPWEKWRVDVVTKPTPWPVKGLRRLSVNSFGVGGTNAHAVLDDAYHYLSARILDGKHYTSIQPSRLPEPGYVR